MCKSSTRTRSVRIKRRAALAALAAAQMGVVALAADTTWTGPAAGTWNVAGNWNNGVPTAGNNTFVDNAAAGLVNVSVTATATTGTLNISAGDQVTVNNNVFLQLNGNGSNSLLNNAGTVLLNSGANSSRLRLTHTGGDGTLTGGGTITMSGANAVIDGSPGVRIVNDNNFIQGQGVIGAELITLTNRGTVLANVTGGALTIDPDGGSGTQSFVLNTGTMRATNGGVLVLTGASGGTFDNAGGNIIADTGSAVRLTGSASITGGTLTTSGTGSVRVSAGQNGFLTDIASNGLMVAENNSDFAVSGSILNNGTISLESTVNTTSLEINGNTTFSGTGTILMSGAFPSIDGTPASRLTLGPGQTIRGQGNIGAELITVANSGLIIADVNGGALTLDPDGGSGTLSFLLNNGTMRATNGGTLILTGASGGTFSGVAGTIVANTNSGVLTQLSALGEVGPITGAGTFSATSSSNITATHYRVANMVVNGATARIRAGGGTLGTSKVETLSLVGTGRLDVTDHDLILDYAGSTPIETIRSQIATAFGTGSWNGAGITSSSAAAAAATPEKTGLGYVEATDLFTSFPATFSGQSVDATSVLIGYTLLGDTNLDRSVSIADFSRVAAAFNQPSRWFDGDFNYDGTTGIGDFSLLAANFNKMLPADLPRGSVVPEPAGLGLIGLAGLLAGRRRR